MNCPTCGFETGRAVNFCPRCGWPAGRLHAELPGRELGVPDAGEATAPLVLRNVGAGYVEYGIRVRPDQPWGYLVPLQGERSSSLAERRLGPGETDNSLRVGVDPASLPEDARSVVLEITSSDPGGTRPDEPRPWNPTNHRWRAWRLEVPLRRLGKAEIIVCADLVVFTARTREVRVPVRNLGGTSATVSLGPMPEGIRAGWEEPPATVSGAVLEVTFEDEPPAPPESATSITVPAESMRILTLRALDDFRGPARLELDCGGAAQALLLYAELRRDEPNIVQRWTLGMDFGTAKSAVYYTDNRADPQDREPRPVLWPMAPGSADRTATTTRSAILYRSDSPVPVCGHNVVVAAGAEGPGQMVIESMKTHLRGATAEQTIGLPGGRELSPVQIVAEFMRYLMDEVRAAGPFRGQVDMDARLVLTLPVMENAASYASQREHTLKAAEMAGLAIEGILTPSEPECAALDLMHSLRRGEYTFDGRTYHLQDGELILVFDCGAGTTDVAVLQVAISDGRYRAVQRCAAGYRFGGDTVDDLLLSWLLDQRADQVRFGWDGARALMKLPEMDRPLSIHAAREECRRLKESLFLPGAPEAVREFHTDLGSFQVSPAHVERLVIPFLESICSAGVMPDPALFFPKLSAALDDRLRQALWREMTLTARTRIRPLGQMLTDAGLRRGDITFLFITGGTGQIPVIAPRLYDALGKSQRVVVATPADCTVNVARGASLYYDYRVAGILACDLDLVVADPESGRELVRQRLCPRGALPGISTERGLRMGARQELRVELRANYAPDGPEGAIAIHRVRNPAPEPRQLVISAEYGSDQCFWWQAAFVEGETGIAREAALRL